MKFSNRVLVEKLTRSSIYRDYQRAFSTATGMPLALRDLETGRAGFKGSPNENPFCQLMAQSNRVCAECLAMQRRLTAHLGAGARTLTCFAGLSDSAVPVRVGDTLIGILQTGQVFLEAPSKFKFDQAARKLVEWGVKVDLGKAREAYFHTKILDKRQYRALLKLLEVFSRHLSLLSNQLTVESSPDEPMSIARARRYIAQNQSNPLCLATVAKAVNTSTHYFCRLFKRATGLTFTAYLSRVRVEKAKELLRDRNRRVSEVAYEVGFQSLTHFNRAFREIVGRSPTQYRARRP